MDTIEIYKNYFNIIADLSDESNQFHKYNKWISDNLKIVRMNDFNELLEDPEISRYMRLNNVTEQGMCYCNAGRIVSSGIQDVSYCEGYFLLNNLPIPFDHAWIRYKGRYYDTTIRDGGVNPEYALIHEFKFNDIIEYQLKLKRYGPYIPEYFNEQFNTNII